MSFNALTKISKPRFFGAFSQRLLALTLLISLVFSSQALAQNIHLSLCIDGSGSVSAADFALQLSGTGDAIQDVIPADGSGSVELSAIVFAATINPVDLNGAAAGNSIQIFTQADKDAAETAILAAPRPATTTNIQGCISQAMVQMGCGPAVLNGTPTCPDDGVTRVIDISTDGDPTENNYDSDGTNDCGTSAAGIVECNEDTYDAAVQASNAGVDVINVIGVGGGPSVTNMITWAFDGNLPYNIMDGTGNQTEVFDPGDIYNENSGTDGLGVPPLPVSLLPGYSNGLPVIGDSGYVVVVADFTEYQPTINAKIFNELNIEGDISVVKTADQTSVPPGGTLTYTLAVTNNDVGDVPDVLVTDVLPAGVMFVSADDNPSTADVVCVEASGIITCDIATLAGSSTTNIDVVVTVN